MKLLFGTSNQAKLSAMKSRLEGLNIELIGLNDLKAEGRFIPEVTESGKTPLENARLKALAYYEAFRMPVFSCDSGLYFDNVPDEVQPSVHVRNINGKCLSDEEMREYYAGLTRRYGNGRLIARYKNAICLVMDEERIYEAMEPSMESEKFILTDTPCGAIREKGFPLDSMSIDIKTGKYYYDLADEELEKVAVEDGILEFFERVKASNACLDINLRLMTINDYSDVYNLWMSCKGMGLNNIDDSEGGIKKFLDRNPDTCFVAEEGNRIIGVIMAGNDGRRGYIYHTAVSPAHRNQGIATKLVDKTLEALQKIGITKTALVVFDRNETGNAFWENQGFTVREDLVYRNRTLTEMERIDT